MNIHVAKRFLRMFALIDYMYSELKNHHVGRQGQYEDKNGNMNIILDSACIFWHVRFTTKDHSFFDLEFWSKKPPIWFFFRHVQLDQSAILDKSIWT